MINMTLTNPSYAFSRSVQLTWISWHGVIRTRSDGLYDICHFILAWAQELHSVINEPWSLTPKQFLPSLCKLIRSGCPIWACQRAALPFDAGLGIHKFGFPCCLWIHWVISILDEPSFSNTYWPAILFKVQIITESLFQNRMLLIISQKMLLAFNNLNDTRLVMKSV